MLRRIGWLILAWYALSASWEELALAWTPWSEIGQPFRDSYRANLGWVIVHGVAAVTALLVGTLQLLRTSGSGHRWLGRVYAVAVLLGGITGFQMGLRAMDARALFCLVAVAWLWTTWRAVAAARARRFDEHSAWMIRSYALTFGAVTLRVCLTALTARGYPLAEIYAPCVLMAWIPNILLAELWLLRRRHRAWA